MMVVVENHTASICRVTLFVECCNDVVEENVLVKYAGTW